MFSPTEHLRMPGPDWTTLYALAATQDGHFTTSQAADAGYSRPLLDHHVKAGRFLRVLRGIYRLRDFPSADHEELVVAWLSLERSARGPPAGAETAART